MFVYECFFVLFFVCFYSEVYGLYLNKTVGTEQSILHLCVCVCENLCL